MKKLNNKGFAISTIIYGTFILFIMILAILLASMNSSLRLLKDKVNNINNFEIDENLSDGANVPDLSVGLIPVVYDPVKGNKSHWFIADISRNWYDYDKQRWANGVSIKADKVENYKNADEVFIIDKEIEFDDMLAMFVWIPRFSYTIGCTSSTSCYGYRMNDDSDKDSGTPSQALPGAIDIIFVKEDITNYCTENPKYTYSIYDNGMPKPGRKPTNFCVHPAFWWDKDDDGEIGDGESLSGIWVGKFETTRDSDSNNNNPTILPDKRSIIDKNLHSRYNTAFKFTGVNNVYGLSGESHLMKNIEWGAVAYLSQSKYGKYGNTEFIGGEKEIYYNNSGLNTGNLGAQYTPYYTGRSSGSSKVYSSENENGSYKYNGVEIKSNGQEGDIYLNKGTGASTTGTIYGIYDMSGGAYESVMAFYSYPGSNFGSSQKGNFSGFTNDNKPESKYFDLYCLSSDNKCTKSRGTISGDGSAKDINGIGDATIETHAWYEDYNFGISNSATWLLRGGNFHCISNDDEDSCSNGIFQYFGDLGDGDVESFRTVLINPPINPGY